MCLVVCDVVFPLASFLFERANNMFGQCTLTPRAKCLFVSWLRYVVLTAFTITTIDFYQMHSFDYIAGIVVWASVGAPKRFWRILLLLLLFSESIVCENWIDFRFLMVSILDFWLVMSVLLFGGAPTLSLSSAKHNPIKLQLKHGNTQIRNLIWFNLRVKFFTLAYTLANSVCFIGDNSISTITTTTTKTRKENIYAIIQWTISVFFIDSLVDKTNIYSHVINERNRSCWCCCRRRCWLHCTYFSFASRLSSCALKCGTIKKNSLSPSLHISFRRSVFVHRLLLLLSKIWNMIVCNGVRERKEEWMHGTKIA